ncbi:MBOAT family O-acyltransferase [Echinicola vietnamensis]|uniref:Putative membrane protein involved in D-alanine export n=1 Tax=Echinicola vietnamensis (strain DSM 17526 / LMG 23754 / KMM 6221) TaxID=926556 RepID=L0G306_ECHVK|nr:MBOAT family O-acyltransferase [Echinicola vietnamensis]AGA79225.1 putative membrane protein involved in D-alanine export [Echinicola vietnamensis DSM 17526]
MLFNSIEFAFFLPIVFFIYWLVLKNTVKGQNIWLLIASYFFYGWWDWRFLFLILFSSIVDYTIGLNLHKATKVSQRKLLLFLSVFINIGFLCYFKYFNFFLDSLNDAFTLLGKPLEASRLSIILPVGISFYTFQTLSYTIDIYKRKLEPTKDIVAFFTFVSFFPQLVAGPIERASHLLPQFSRKRKFSYDMISQGGKLMLWGLFMKVVVADRLAIYVDDVYMLLERHSWLTLFTAHAFFAFQIYCDFAGYSLIAIGCAKLFDFHLMDNFRRPYFATSFKSFWSRWHISLSTWFKDYVYIPIGGNRQGDFRAGINLMITFIISGFWHGANWTYIIWGALHGFYQIMEKYVLKFKLPKAINWLIVFGLTCLAWVFFRAPSVSDAMTVLQRIVTFQGTGLYFGDKGIFLFGVMGLFILLLHDYIMEFKPNYQFLYHRSPIVRYAAIVILMMFITTFGVFDNSQFIYFQF